MGRTNNLWVLVIYKDDEKKEFYKTISCSTLTHIAYILNKKVYDVSNVYHRITKPTGVFNYLTILKTL